MKRFIFRMTGFFVGFYLLVIFGYAGSVFPEVSGELDSQAFVGWTFADSGSFTIEKASILDPALVAELDLGDMPVVGGVAARPFGLERGNIGVEAGLFLSWNSESVSVRSANGFSVIRIDNSLLLFDLFSGPYVEKVIREKIRIYGAAGPSFHVGLSDLEVEDHNTVNATRFTINGNDTVTGFGYYIRGGIEFLRHDGSFVGIGIKRTDVSLDMGSAFGDLDAAATQVALTFTTRW